MLASPLLPTHCLIVTPGAGLFIIESHSCPASTAAFASIERPIAMHMRAAAVLYLHCSMSHALPQHSLFVGDSWD